MSSYNVPLDLSQVERGTEESLESLPDSPKVGSMRDQPIGQIELLGVVYGIGMNLNHVIGSGIVTAPGSILKAIKYPGIVLSLWLVGGMVSMAGSLSYV